MWKYKAGFCVYVFLVLFCFVFVPLASLRPSTVQSLLGLLCVVCLFVCYDDDVDTDVVDVRLMYGMCANLRGVYSECVILYVRVSESVQQSCALQYTDCGHHRITSLLHSYGFNVLSHSTQNE